RDRISVGDLLEALRHRALGALMFIFAAPTALLMPPGVSAITGAPLLFLSIQLMLGLRPWLPRIISARSLSRVDFEKVVKSLAPWLARAESIMRPRFSFLGRRPSLYAVGLACFVMSVILFLPIPLGNMLPSAAIAVMALGLLERDGIWIGIGFAAALLSVVIVWGVVWASVVAGLFLLQTFVGLG
ncbi:MAG TPA: exopolysaccharide biosynthesis protein, partial [Alphaproteobacteria bacterium]|nr:exopolysaccharide biosynthesis protein [Alphaproteobacteria bacterium]